MNELTKEELCNVQVEVMEKFAAFCRENGLHYSLAAGTLIGAARHRGFIPWDDDVDIYMGRADYQKALQLLAKSPSPEFKTCTYATLENYPYPFAKISDTRTKLVENGYSYDIGVYIDLFPIDAVPDGRFGALKTKFFFALARLARLAGNLKSGAYYRARSEKSFVKFLLFRSFLFVCPRNLIFAAFDKFAAAQWSNPTKKACDVLWGNGIAGAFDRRGMESFVKLDFEGRKFDAMSAYKEYLENTYGDYMTPPPPQARASVHDFKAYWR